MASFYPGRLARSSFEKSRAEEKFKNIRKADENFVLNKEKAKRVDQEKMARLKALRLAKEASESA